MKFHTFSQNWVFHVLILLVKNNKWEDNQEKTNFIVYRYCWHFLSAHVCIIYVDLKFFICVVIVKYETLCHMHTTSLMTLYLKFYFMAPWVGFDYRPFLNFWSRSQFWNFSFKWLFKILVSLKSSVYAVMVSSAISLFLLIFSMPFIQSTTPSDLSPCRLMISRYFTRGNSTSQVDSITQFSESARQSDLLGIPVYLTNYGRNVWVKTTSLVRFLWLYSFR